MTTFSAGTLIAGRYRLDGRIDEGGTAQVWRANDQELNRPVALKILVTPEAGDPAFVEAFRNEAQVEARLKHPNIVEVFDWGHDGDANYVVMELLEGRTVRQMLGEGVIDSAHVVTIGRQASAALAYAHAEGVYHGTITDSMILVSPDGHATVIGFGAWCRGQCETPPSPDADTYALGGVLYEMLTGASPFGPRPPQVGTDEKWPEHPHKLVAGVPPELDHVVMKAVAADPAERYKTAAELEADLDAIARPKRHTWLWILLAAALVVLAGVGAYLFATQMKIVVPSVVGKTTAEAAASLTNAKLRMVVTGQAPSATIAEGLVVSETPTAGVKVQRNTQVGVVVSSGKPTVAVPSVTGSGLQSASSAIAGAGLVVGAVTKQNSSTFPVDTVISQTPAGGQETTVGSTVDLVVSSGQATVTLPDVRGTSQATATNKLTGLGMQVTVAQAFSSASVGIVVSQSPAAGATVPKGGTVTITVSKGAAPVKVPNVVGATAADAKTSLQNVGLVPVSVFASSSATTGTVFDQSPQAGSSVSKGSQVRITISK